MKRIHKNWLVRVTVGFAAVTSLRLISTLFHVTTLERLYKPRDFRKTSHLTIDGKIMEQLPKYCYNLFGQKMDPINLIFVGTPESITRVFDDSGWHGAHPNTPLHQLVNLLSGLTRRSYKKSPFMPLFTGIGLQDISFQKAERNGFSDRHHIRLWRTRHQLPGGRRIWVAAATHEEGLKIIPWPPFFPHRMDPDLDQERAHIIEEVTAHGALLADHYELNQPISIEKPKKNPHLDRYYTDGLAAIIELKG